MATIGLIGAGHIGSQIARLAVVSGYEVVISNSRGPETLSGLVAELGHNARAATTVAAAQSGDIVVVTVPLKNYRAVPVEPLAGKIVIDTNNYYPERDGHIPELDSGSIAEGTAMPLRRWPCHNKKHWLVRCGCIPVNRASRSSRKANDDYQAPLHRRGAAP